MKKRSMERVIFLDIDGVLIPSIVWASKAKGQLPKMALRFLHRVLTDIRDVVAREINFSTEAIRLANEVTRTCDARMVISSNWPMTMGRRRTYQRLGQAGLDTTLLHEGWCIGLRGILKSKGIALWVERHPGAQGVIVDDADLEQTARDLELEFVQVDQRVGFAKSDAEKVRHSFEK